MTALAHEHLPAAAAAEFIAMLRPAVRLEHAADGDPVVAQVGGLPLRSVETWPEWEGHGPLSHVLSFECVPVAALLPDLGLPATGSLAFFYLDDDGSGVPPPVDALYEALWKLPPGYDTHQIGGHPDPVQGPVEMEVEQLRRGLLDEPFEWTDPAVQAAATDWNLLQVASDGPANMMLGDAGQLYYLVRGTDGPEDALFTWQCP